jgi:hypothetical protein
MMRILAVFTCLALAGCVHSPVPLESGAARLSDPALIGYWKFDIDGEPAIATITENADGDVVADVIAYWEPGPKADTRHFQVVLARFDQDRYLSFRDMELSPLYSLARYQFESQDRFRVYGGYSEELIEALKQKRIPGELKPDRHMPTVELSASSRQLRSFFREFGARAFHDESPLVFERVASPVLPPFPADSDPQE